MNKLMLGFAAAVMSAALTAGAAVAAPVEFRFDNPLPGGGANPLPSFTHGGLTATTSCAVYNPLSGTVCSVTQNAEGLGAIWNRPGNPDDTSGELDGSFRAESLTITFNQKVRIVRIDFEDVTDIDFDFFLVHIHEHDESALIIDGVNKGFGRISSGLGINGATTSCSGVDDGSGGKECDVTLAALNWTGTSFTFGGPNLDSDDAFRIESIVVEAIPEPMSMALFGSTLLGLGFARRRR
jgi:hypothetical protein